MCEIINFNEYKRFKGARRDVQTEKRIEECRKLNVQELLTKEWAEEYMHSNWGLSKLVFHIIEQYGYLRCTDKKRYVFEDIKRDAKYYEMYPEVENKRLKAPLWVKVSGEWYFVEMYTDTASFETFRNKMAALGNYGIKGFCVDLYGLKTQEIKRLLKYCELVELVKKINDIYFEHSKVEKTSSECRTSVKFIGEKTKRDCTYKMLEETCYYAILEGTELESGNKHFVLLYKECEPKEYAKHFKEQYGKTGIPLLYAKWDKWDNSSWWLCIKRCSTLYKRLKVQ